MDLATKKVKDLYSHNTNIICLIISEKNVNKDN